MAADLDLSNESRTISDEQIYNGVIVRDGAALTVDSSGKLIAQDRGRVDLKGDYNSKTTVLSVNGGTVEAAGSLHVSGNNSAAEFLNGASASFGQVWISDTFYPETTAYMSIDGVGTEVEFRNSSFIGQRDTGNLELSNGGKLTTRDNLWLGHLNGTADISIASGAVLSSKNLEAQSGGTVSIEVDGGTIQAREDNASFISGFDSDDTFTLSGVGMTLDTQAFNVGIQADLTGAGGLTKTGTGTLTLTGENTYSGGTNVYYGTLAGNTKSLQGDIATAAVTKVRFDQTTNGTYSGVLSGAGELTKNGAGTLTLTGENTYSGGTLIQQGAIAVNGEARLGTGTTTIDGGGLSFTGSGSASFSKVALGSGGGTLDVVNESGRMTVSSDLSGQGSLTKTGDGTLILTGNNSYEGFTWLQEGTLQGTTDGLQGYISSSAGTTLSFDQSTSGTSSVRYVGDGRLVKTGNGTVTLTGTNSHTGGTVVEQGTLSGRTSNLIGDISVANGATLEVNPPSGSTADTSFTANVSGEGRLVKTGPNSLVLQGQYTHTGGTRVEGGSLVVKSSNLQGDVAISDEGWLRFYQETSGTHTGNITGGGKIDKYGSGTLILSGKNTYGGGTTVSKGTLAGDTDSLQGVFGLGSNANVRFDQAANGTFKGDISGVGTVTKRGTGTLTVTDAINVNGVTIEEGRLVGTTENMKSNVDVGIGAEFEFDQNDDGTFYRVISGEGKLIKSGEGDITLTRANTYSGGTLINGGVLTVSHINQLGTGAISLNGGTFRTTGTEAIELDNFDLDDSDGELDVSGNTLSLTGAVTTTGSLEKTGAGVLNLDAANNVVGGPTVVKDGKLVVGSSSDKNTASLQSNVEVEGTGILGGHGSIIGNVTNNNGRIAPGNSIGVTTITGNYSGTGVLEIEVEGNVDASLALADQLVVTGDVDVSGTTLELVMTPNDSTQWDVAPTGPFIILDNQGTNAITGTFTDVQDINDLLFLDETLDYAAGDGNDISLILTRNDVTFEIADASVNQNAVGAVIGSMDTSNAVYNAVVMSTSSEAEAAAAYDSLSGEINASARGALIEDSRFARTAVNDRLYEASAGDAARVGSDTNTEKLGGLALWSQAFGSWGQSDADGNAAEMDRSTGGVMFGADALAFGTARVGVMGGYSTSNMDVDARQSSMDSDNYTIGAYIGSQFDQFKMRGGVAATWHQMDGKRSVSLGGGTFTDSVTSDQDAMTFQAFGELGYSYDVSGVSLEPFAGLAYVNLKSDGFTEEGGNAVLTADDQSDDVLFTTLGLRVASTFMLGDTAITARGMAGWQHASEETIDFTQSFASGGNSFTVEGTPIAQDVGLVEAGFAAALSDRASVGVTYSGQIASDAQNHGLNARFSLQF
ncbi:autotransporter domain-containing protein [Pseudovibrio exalbescens]|uniref:autotransporter domain-containing protein n=1 Tax=Pseudovibrio exalbescens TaxID=197461 RepID=UPI0015E0C9A7|nr:autotransporter domain-containing protein [Pseudovibrio exalbescens]